MCPVAQIGIWFGKCQFDMYVLLKRASLYETISLTFVTLLQPGRLFNSTLNIYFVYIPAFSMRLKTSLEQRTYLTHH